MQLIEIQIIMFIFKKFYQPNEWYTDLNNFYKSCNFNPWKTAN